MIEYEVNYNSLAIKALPTNNSEIVGYFQKGEKILTGGKPIMGDDNNYYVCYISETGLLRYVCYKDQNGKKNLTSTSKNFEEPSDYFKNNNDCNISKNFSLSPFLNENNFNNNFFNNDNLFINSQIEFSNTIKSGIYKDSSFINIENNNLPNNISSPNQDIKEIFIVDYMQNISNSYNKNDYYKPRHDKFNYDNMMKKAKSLSINIIRKKINLTLKKIKELKKYFLQAELLTLKQNKNYYTKNDYLNLLKLTFREIFSSEVSSKCKNKKEHNKEIFNKLDELYKKKINEKEIKDLIDFLNMKYEDFFEELNNNEKNSNIDEKTNTNKFILSLIKDFLTEVDIYLNKDKGKEEKKEEYKKKFIELLKKFPSRINKMKVLKEK